MGMGMRKDRIIGIVVLLVLLAAVVLMMGAGTSVNGSRVLQSTLNYCAPAGASGTTYTCNMTPPLAAYTTGACYSFLADVANTGAATINFNSIGASNIDKVTGGITTALVANDIRASQMVSICYNGTNMQMQSTLGNTASISPGGSATEIQSRLNGTTLQAVVGTSTLPQTGWSLINASTDLLYNDFAANELVASIQDISASINYRLVTRSVPDATFTIIAKFECVMPNGVSAEACGIYLSDGTKIEGAELLEAAGVAPGVRFITNVTVTGTPTVVQAAGAPDAFDLTFKIVEDGAHTTWSYWNNGAFVQIIQRTTHTFLTPSTGGFGGDTVINNGIYTLRNKLKYWCYSAATTTCNGL